MEVIVRKVLSTYFFSENLVYFFIYFYIAILFEFEVMFWLLYLKYTLWTAFLCPFFYYANNFYEKVDDIYFRWDVMTSSENSKCLTEGNN